MASPFILKMETKQIGIALGIVLMISLASAVTIYSGSNYTFVSEEFEYYTVTGNSSNMEGMNATWANGNITITFDPLFAADTFTLIFFNNYTEIINKYYSDNDCGNCGGGTRIIYKNRNITTPGETIVVNDTTINLDETPEKGKTIPWWLWTSIILVIAFIVGFWMTSKNKQTIEDETTE